MELFWLQCYFGADWKVLFSEHLSFAGLARPWFMSWPRSDGCVALPYGMPLILSNSGLFALFRAATSKARAMVSTEPTPKLVRRTHPFTLSGGALKERRRRRAEKWSSKTREWTATCSQLPLDRKWLHISFGNNFECKNDIALSKINSQSLM